MLLGFVIAWYFYIVNPNAPKALAKNQRHLHAFLMNKWYFDELYDLIFVRPVKRLGYFLWKKGDGRVIDGAINGIAMGIVPWFTKQAAKAQSGYLFHYAFWMFAGVVVLITWVSIGGAH